jgi:hypothetical protein
VAFKVQLLRVQLPAAFKGSIAGGVQCCAFNASRSMPVAFNACGVQRVQLPVAFNAARSMLRVQCLGRSLLRVQLPAAFNAARSIATRLIACGVQCCAFNATRSIACGV